MWKEIAQLFTIVRAYSYSTDVTKCQHKTIYGNKGNVFNINMYVLICIHMSTRFQHASLKTSVLEPWPPYLFRGEIAHISTFHCFHLPVLAFYFTFSIMLRPLLLLSLYFLDSQSLNLYSKIDIHSNKIYSSTI